VESVVTVKGLDGCTRADRSSVGGMFPRALPSMTKLRAWTMSLGKMSNRIPQVPESKLPPTVTSHSVRYRTGARSPFLAASGHLDFNRVGPQCEDSGGGIVRWRRRAVTRSFSKKERLIGGV